MIIIKSKQEIAIMREAAKVTGELLRTLPNVIKPGMSTLDIDRFVEDFIRGHKMTPSFKGLYGFPASACVSVNEEVVHGIPSKDKILVEGDIVSVDVGSTYKGFCSDACRTYPVGQISDVHQRLIDSAKAGFDAAMEFCRVGYRVSDMSHAVQERVEADGFGVIRDYVGHGVGRDMHEDPQIPNFGKAGRGPRLQEGMVVAVEPMIVEGSYDVDVLENDWTVVTLDGGWAAHYENTVVINDGEPELLTI